MNIIVLTPLQISEKKKKFFEEPPPQVTHQTFTTMNLSRPLLKVKCVHVHVSGMNCQSVFLSFRIKHAALKLVRFHTIISNCI